MDVYLVHQTDAAVRAVAFREATARILEQTGPERERGGRGRSVRAVGSEREQKVHTSKDGNPLIDGRGNRRRMRGRSDVVEYCGVQHQGATMIGLEGEDPRESSVY
jgi:hypothetical protein